MQYTIEAEPFPVVLCSLTNHESMVTESGAMSWMSPNMQMETNSKGGFTGMLGRIVSGESLFLNKYTANGDGFIAFSSKFPGEILTYEISPDRDLVVQKSGFLAATEGVELSIFFQKKLGAGFFGGEGFIMQKLSGHGTAFIEIDGSLKEYTLAAGQQIILSTGYLAAMESTCSIDIKSISGVKNIFFGGQGLVNTVVTGPGRVFVQTKPISALAAVLRPFFPSNTTSVSSD